MAITYAEVDLGVLEKNAKVLKRAIGNKKLMAVLKANAYGHGVGPTAGAVLRGGADYIGVARAEEAETLRQGGVIAPVQVIGKVLADELAKCSSVDAEVTISDLQGYSDAVKTARLSGKPVKAHLKVDTGMGRQGFLVSEAKKYFPKIFRAKEVEIVGIFTHFSSADSDEDYTLDQRGQFDDLLNFLRSKKIKLPIIHAANSAAVLSGKDYHYDMVRAGIALYGYPPIESKIGKNLHPAMRFVSHLVSVRNVPKGWRLSYDGTYTTPRKMRVGVVAAGYADGVPRELSNHGEVLVRGERCAILGKVCMDQFVVDLSGVRAEAGDEVVIYGKQGRREIQLAKVADRIGKIPYELMCQISARVPRAYKA